MSGTTKVVKNVNISSTFETRREIISSIASTVRYSVPIITWGSSFGVSVGKKQGSVRAQDPFGADLGIISGSGSFLGLYKSLMVWRQQKNIKQCWHKSLAVYLLTGNNNFKPRQNRSTPSHFMIKVKFQNWRTSEPEQGVVEAIWVATCSADVCRCRSCLPQYSW